MPTIAAEAAKTFFDHALKLEMQDDRIILGQSTLAVTIAVTEAPDPEAVGWVRGRRLDAGFFPVIVDVETRQVIYPGLTLLGALDWVVKRRLVRRHVAPAVSVSAPDAH